MSWLDMFRVEAEKRNAETAVVIRDALAAEEVRKAEEAARKAEEQKRIEDEARKAEVAARQDVEDQRRIKAKLRKSAWSDRNRKRLNDYQNNYRKNHPQKPTSAEYRRKWAAANPGKNAEYQRRYRARIRAMKAANAAGGDK